MANLTSLVGATAEALDLDLATVREQARVLRDAGLMAKQKAGRSGGSVGIRDTINLLLAAVGTARPSRSCDPVEQHGACLAEGGRWELPSIVLPKVKELPTDHSLADLLEALVDSCVSGDVDLETGAIANPLRNVHLDRLSVEVVMFEPLIWTEVKIGLSGRDADDAPIRLQEEERVYKQRFGLQGQFAHPPFQARPWPALSHHHIFDERIFLTLAEVLKE